MRVLVQLIIPGFVFLGFGNGLFALNEKICKQIDNYENYSKVGFEVYYPGKLDSLDSISKKFNISRRSIIESSRMNPCNDVQLEYCLLIPKQNGIIQVVDHDPHSTEGKLDAGYLHRLLRKKGLYKASWFKFNNFSSLSVLKKNSIIFADIKKSVVHNATKSVNGMIRPLQGFAVKPYKRDPFTGKKLKYLPLGVRFHGISSELVHAVKGGKVVSIEGCTGQRNLGQSNKQQYCKTRSRCEVTVKIQHEDLQSIYRFDLRHLYIVPGSEVVAGQAIAREMGGRGCTGNSTSLDLGLMKNNKYINAYRIFDKLKNQSPD